MPGGTKTIEYSGTIPLVDNIMNGVNIIELVNDDNINTGITAFLLTEYFLAMS